MKNSVAALAIIASFAIGTIVTATPQVEAAGGWKEAFDQLLVQINVLEDKVQTLEENNVNCNNEWVIKNHLVNYQLSESCYDNIEFCEQEFSVKRTFNEFELSPICQAEVIPLSVIAQDVSTTGIYATETTSWYDEETEEIGEELVYMVECNLNFEGYISEDATFYDSVSINSISIENDGTYELSSFMNPDNLYQAGFRGHPEDLEMSVLVFEKSYGAGFGTAEEIIGTFSILAEVTVSDIFGNTVSDTATYTCSP